MNGYFFLGVLFFSLGVVLMLLFGLGLDMYLVSFDFGSFLSMELLEFSFILDSFSCCFCSVLSFIVSSVFFFSAFYMAQETYKNRFAFMISSFVGFMVVLMLSSSFMSFLIGWDGLGFASFLLVAWFGCSYSRLASLKTFLLKRLGDSFLLVSLVFLFQQGHFNLFTLDLFSSFVVLFFVLASFTKSAQYPFSSWLPAAMAAPTPVSALVHSSTLVTAGVYFLIRFSDILSFPILQIISVIGLFTMLAASVCAALELDVKKIVAYSTLSQLGFMCCCIGLNYMTFCFCYLVVHACFKALMFISVGTYISYGSHFQDLRGLKSMWGLNPVVFLKFLISVLTLSGVPMLSGFIFKDAILFSTCSGVYKFCYFMLLAFSVVLTGMYSFRMLVLSSFSWCVSLSVVSSYSMNLMCFLPLYACSFGLGVGFANLFPVFLHFSVYQAISLLALVVVGASFGMLLNSSFLLEFVSLLKMVVLLFFCGYMNSSFNSLFTSGSCLFKLLDQGMFNLGLLERLNALFSFSYKSLYLSFASVSWLGLLSASGVMVLSLYLL